MHFHDLRCPQLLLDLGRTVLNALNQSQLGRNVAPDKAAASLAEDVGTETASNVFQLGV